MSFQRGLTVGRVPDVLIELGIICLVVLLNQGRNVDERVSRLVPMTTREVFLFRIFDCSCGIFAFDRVPLADTEQKRPVAATDEGELCARKLYMLLTMLSA